MDDDWIECEDCGGDGLCPSCHNIHSDDELDICVTCYESGVCPSCEGEGVELIL